VIASVAYVMTFRARYIFRCFSFYYGLIVASKSLKKILQKSARPNSLIL